MRACFFGWVCFFGCLGCWFSYLIVCLFVRVRAFVRSYLCVCVRCAESGANPYLRACYNAAEASIAAGPRQFAGCCLVPSFGFSCREWLKSRANPPDHWAHSPRPEVS